jgi:predicted lipoprotein
VIRVLALCLLPLAAAAQSRLDPEAAALLQEGLVVTADAFTLPAYEAQAEATAALSAALDAYCAGEGGIAPVQDAFAAAFLAWQRASLIAVGPVAEAEGPMRVQLWPDPKDFARRAVRVALLAEDPALLAPGGLEGRSVALTNLTALERLVHGDLPPGGYPCALARAVADHQAGLAAGFAEAWTPGSAFRAEHDGALGGAGRYPDVEALIREMLAGAVVHVDRLRKFKLQRGLGAAPGEARPERTEAHASGLGLASVEASFRALADLYETPYGLFDTAPDAGGSMDYFTLAQSAAGVADALTLEPATLAEIAEEDGAAAERLRTYAELALRHEGFLKTGFPGSLGLVSGFTAADGD